MTLKPTATRYEFQRPELFAGEPMGYNYRAIAVEWRGGGTWAVTEGSGRSSVWSEKKGEWEYEPLPSSRSKAFLRRTRYPLDEALAIAERLANEDSVA